MTDDEFIEMMVAEMERLDPCIVDAFEDALAAKLGLLRHPELSRTEWRELRVGYINALDPEYEHPEERLDESKT